MKAHTLYRLDHHYVVQEGAVIIVDEFTGRLMQGRRWSDGLHQAVEAKEGVKIERENQTLATITLQNYFRLYDKLSGMTGTAETEAAEFDATYKLEVAVIPTNRSMIRKDHSDVIYRTLPEKWDAIVEEIIELHESGQPVLVGTVSVENSELISRRLSKAGIRHRDESGQHSHRGRRQHPRVSPRPQRQAPRARGRDRRAGRSQGRDHDRDQHGRARHGHPVRRQPRVPRARAPQASGDRPRRGDQRAVRGGDGIHQALRRARAQGGRLCWAACTSSAPSATSRAASTTSCAGAPDGRATRALRASSSRSKTT